MSSWPSPGEGPAATAVPGMRLGDRYVLRSPIASGGMAQVWSGTDELLDRDVAIKVLHPHLTTDDAFVERFRREAVAAASLSHRAIVAVFDTISADGIEAIVMELIEGKTLRAVLDEVRTMSANDLVHLSTQIADALDIAHAAGIVHRDIKPANIMVGPGRVVKVTDFGIAKAGSDADLTATGTLLGTAKYLSPEQVTGAAIDPRSDIYALGVVMFEALTGSPPFKANTDAATALARLHQTAPPVSQLRPDVPRLLEQIVERAMARDPDDRFRRARDLSAALQALTDNPASRDDSAPTTVSPRPVPSAHGGNRPVPPTPPGGGGGRLVPPDPREFGDPGTSPLRATERLVPPDPPGTRGAQPFPPSPPGATGYRPDDHDFGAGSAVDGGAAHSAESVVRTRSSRFAPFAAVAAIVVGVGGAVIALSDASMPMLGSSEVTPPPEQVSPDVVIASLTSFDPQTLDSDKTEREDLVDLAVDDDPATAWRTERYNRPRLGGLKDGVGLILTLEQPVPLSEIVLLTDSEGWTIDVFVADTFSADGSDWGEPVATFAPGSSGVTAGSLEGAQAERVLIWVRDTGTTNGEIRFRLNEVDIS